MSFILMAKALKVDFPDTHTKLLMITLADYANEETGECYPSLTTLAKRTCMSKQTVTVKLNWLEENKWITRDRGTFNKSTRYYLNLDKETVVREDDSVVRQTDRVVRQTDTNLPITYKQPINKNYNKKISADSNYCKTFEIIWKNYPNKKGKAIAYKKYLMAVKKYGKDEILNRSRIVIEDYNIQINRKELETKYIPHLSTFFNQERYQDWEIIEEQNKPKRLTKNQMAG